MHKTKVEQDEEGNVRHKYVRFVVARGPYTALSADHYVDDPSSFARGLRAALPYELLKEWGVTIEIRARRTKKRSDWAKPGVLVARPAPVAKVGARRRRRQR